MAEIGKGAAGFFHELMNPLTAIVLSIEELKNKTPELVAPLEPSLEEILATSRRIENFIEVIQKPFTKEDYPAEFSVNQQIKEAILLLSHKAKTHNIKIKFEKRSPINLYGKAAEFCHAVYSILSNIIESYSNTAVNVITINIDARENRILTKISTSGSRNINKPKTNRLVKTQRVITSLSGSPFSR